MDNYTSDPFNNNNGNDSNNNYNPNIEGSSNQEAQK